MSKKTRHSSSGLENFLNYLRGVISKKDQHHFEREMMRDPFTEDAMEGFEQFDTDQIEADLNLLSSRLNTRTHKRKLFLFPVVKYAAAAIILFTFGITVFLIRQSVKQAQKLDDIAAVADTSEHVIPNELQSEADSLKKNIALSESEKKVTHQAGTKKQLSAFKDTKPERQRHVKSDATKSILTGTIISASLKRPIPDVHVMIEGTPYQTLTDMNGKYSLQVPGIEEQVVIFSAVGYSTQEVIVRGSQTINLAMVDATVEMDEVVVIGYGTQSRESVTGSIASIRHESVRPDSLDLNPLRNQNALQGIASGIEIEYNELAQVEIADLELAQAKEQSAPISKASPVQEKKRAYSDGKLVTGRVLSRAGEPLPGVNVIEEGTTNGTVTDLDGNFSIQMVGNNESVLSINYIGYVSEQVSVTDQNNFTLYLSEDLLALEEVVVVGYGTADKFEQNNAPEETMIIKPMPIIGVKKYKDYINENIRYQALPDFDKTVIVRLRFTISPAGVIKNIMVHRSGGDAFDKEAIRLVKEGPVWKAGTKDGVPFEDDILLKIKFLVQE